RGHSALFEPVLDESAVAREAQPVGVGLVALARANRGARSVLLAVLRKLVGPALLHLHQVPAERRLERRAHRTDLEIGHRAFELGHGVAGREPAQVSALGGRSVLRVDLRELAEILAAGDARAQALEPRAHFGIRQPLAGPDEDVARERLLHARGRRLAALL